MANSENAHQALKHNAAARYPNARNGIRRDSSRPKVKSTAHALSTYLNASVDGNIRELMNSYERLIAIDKFVDIKVEFKGSNVSSLL